MPSWSPWLCWFARSTRCGSYIAQWWGRDVLGWERRSEKTGVNKLYKSWQRVRELHDRVLLLIVTRLLRRRHLHFAQQLMSTSTGRRVHIYLYKRYIFMCHSTFQLLLLTQLPGRTWLAYRSSPNSNYLKTLIYQPPFFVFLTRFRLGHVTHSRHSRVTILLGDCFGQHTGWSQFSMGNGLSV